MAQPLRTSGEAFMSDVVPGECFVPLEGSLKGTKIFMNPVASGKTPTGMPLGWCHDYAPNYAWMRSYPRNRVQFIPKWDASSCALAVQDEQKHDRFPHTCPRCSAPAYIGLLTTECSKRC